MENHEARHAEYFCQLFSKIRLRTKFVGANFKCNKIDRKAIVAYGLKVVSCMFLIWSSRPALQDNL